MLMFVAGIVGGLICLAFLIGVAIVEPTAILLLALTLYAIWKWILWTERRSGR